MLTVSGITTSTTLRYSVADIGAEQCPLCGNSFPNTEDLVDVRGIAVTDHQTSTSSAVIDMMVCVAEAEPALPRRTVRCRAMTWNTDGYHDLQ